MKSIVIFASGGGSNAAKIISHFANHKDIKVTGIVCNNADAYVVKIAQSNNIPCLVISKKNLQSKEMMLNLLAGMKADYLVLAGFLLLIPPFLIENFRDKIFNIHPSLLPKFGGKGMYGINIHKAVMEAKETQSGLTIHLVNEEFDKGRPLKQVVVPVLPNDTAEDLAARILIEEHAHFGPAIEDFILSNS